MRDDRYLSSNPTGDGRHPGARDRDRVLYSDAFRRLVGVTQVASAHEGRVFHNRLTHSLKVGQLARRMSEHFLTLAAEHAGLQRVIDALGGLDPEAAEAAALAHDLGNPPFGHEGESELDRLVRKKNEFEGFEGNAQGFRIITRLAARGLDPNGNPGLGLTRATLRATLKYPWLRNLNADHEPDGQRGRKWGAYGCDDAALAFALELAVAPGERDENHASRSLEAEVMDWADDVTYAVHDTEDFYRAGLIPLEQLVFDQDVRNDFLAKASDGAKVERERAEELFMRVLGLMPFGRYTGTRKDTAAVSHMSSVLIDLFTKAIELNDGEGRSFVSIDPDRRDTVEILKQLIWYYVIERPGLATQQKGQRAVIGQLFDVYEAAAGDQHYLLPPSCTDEAYLESHSRARVAADAVSSLTEQEAVVLHRRLTGYDPGSVRDLLHL